MVKVLLKEKCILSTKLKGLTHYAQHNIGHKTQPQHASTNASFQLSSIGGGEVMIWVCFATTGYGNF